MFFLTFSVAHLNPLNLSIYYRPLINICFPCFFFRRATATKNQTPRELSVPPLDYYANIEPETDGLVDGAPLSAPSSSSSPNTTSSSPLLPKGYDTLVLLGFSGDQDPHLMQYFNFPNDTHLATFLKYSMRQATANPEFPIHFLALRDDRPPEIKDEIRKQHKRLADLTQGLDDRLITIFFRFVYPTYPIVNQREFINAYKNDRSSVDVCLLSGLYAMSCIWWKYDKFELCQKPIPFGFYEKLFKECRIAVERSLKYPTLGTIQGLLLLAQKNIPSTDIPSTFSSSIDISTIISVSHRLGLHLDCTDWSIPASEKLLRKRLWAVVNLVEKWNSANLGMPSLLSNINTTWNDYTEDAPHLQLFVHFCKLTTILDDVVKEFYSVREYANRYKDYKTTISRVEVYLKRLHDWRENLPNTLKNTDYYEPGEPSKNGTLHLAEVTIAVLLLRLKIHPSCTALLDRELNLKYRRQAFITIQRVIKYTTDIDHWHLHSFWHSMANLNFCTLVSFFLLFKVTATSTKEHKDIVDAFKKWENALKQLSKSWDSGAGLSTVKINTMYFFRKDLINVPESPVGATITTTGTASSADSTAEKETNELGFPHLVRFNAKTDEINKKLDEQEQQKKLKQQQEQLQELQKQRLFEQQRKLQDDKASATEEMEVSKMRKRAQEQQNRLQKQSLNQAGVNVPSAEQIELLNKNDANMLDSYFRSSHGSKSSDSMLTPSEIPKATNDANASTSTISGSGGNNVIGSNSKKTPDSASSSFSSYHQQADSIPKKKSIPVVDIQTLQNKFPFYEKDHEFNAPPLIHHQLHGPHSRNNNNQLLSNHSQQPAGNFQSFGNPQSASYNQSVGNNQLRDQHPSLFHHSRHNTFPQSAMPLFTGSGHVCSSTTSPGAVRNDSKDSPNINELVSSSPVSLSSVQGLSNVSPSKSVGQGNGQNLQNSWVDHNDMNNWNSGDSNASGSSSGVGGVGDNETMGSFAYSRYLRNSNLYNNFMKNSLNKAEKEKVEMGFRRLKNMYGPNISNANTSINDDINDQHSKLSPINIMGQPSPGANMASRIGRAHSHSPNISSMSSPQKGSNLHAQSCHHHGDSFDTTSSSLGLLDNNTNNSNSSLAALDALARQSSVRRNHLVGSASSLGGNSNQLLMNNSVDDDGFQMQQRLRQRELLQQKQQQQRAANLNMPDNAYMHPPLLPSSFSNTSSPISPSLRVSGHPNSAKFMSNINPNTNINLNINPSAQSSSGSFRRPSIVSDQVMSHYKKVLQLHQQKQFARDAGKTGQGASGKGNDNDGNEPGDDGSNLGEDNGDDNGVFMDVDEFDFGVSNEIGKGDENEIIPGFGYAKQGFLSNLHNSNSNLNTNPHSNTNTTNTSSLNDHEQENGSIRKIRNQMRAQLEIMRTENVSPSPYEVILNDESVHLTRRDLETIYRYQVDLYSNRGNKGNNTNTHSNNTYGDQNAFDGNENAVDDDDDDDNEHAVNDDDDDNNSDRNSKNVVDLHSITHPQQSFSDLASFWSHMAVVGAAGSGIRDNSNTINPSTTNPIAANTGVASINTNHINTNSSNINNNLGQVVDGDDDIHNLNSMMDFSGDDLNDVMLNHDWDDEKFYVHD